MCHLRQLQTFQHQPVKWELKPTLTLVYLKHHCSVLPIRAPLRQSKVSKGLWMAALWVNLGCTLHLHTFLEPSLGIQLLFNCLQGFGRSLQQFNQVYRLFLLQCYHQTHPTAYLPAHFISCHHNRIHFQIQTGKVAIQVVQIQYMILLHQQRSQEQRTRMRTLSMRIS